MVERLHFAMAQRTVTIAEQIREWSSPSFDTGVPFACHPLNACARVAPKP